MTFQLAFRASKARSYLSCLSRILDFEQLINIKFCFVEKSTKKVHKMLKSVNGNNVVALKNVYKWYEQFT